MARNVAGVAGHVAGRVRREWATFVNCPRPCCWPRFWPRSSQCGHVLATFVATFRSCSTWPEHGHNMAEHAGHVTTWPMRHFAGHVSATFVATFRSRSWPRSGHVCGHVQTCFLKFFCVFFLEVLKFCQMRIVYGFGTVKNSSKTCF